MGKCTSSRKARSAIRKEYNMTAENFSFIVYLIHACANRWQQMPSEVYQKLRRAGCIDAYLIPHYDILHTQGTEYLVDDIQTYLETRGIAI